MNSHEFGHERFEELSALSAIGQISAEEFRELQAHLKTCATCRLREADFTEILHEHLPLLAPTDAAMPGSRNVAFHDASYKQRFIQRARKEGIVFSPEVTGAKIPGRSEASRWRIWRGCGSRNGWPSHWHWWTGLLAGQFASQPSVEGQCPAFAGARKHSG